MLEIEPGAERLSCALQPHHAGDAIALQAFEIAVERLDQRRIERVEVFGAIERHPVDPLVMFDQQRFCHAGLLLHRRPGERRDPYAVLCCCGMVVDAFLNKNRRWLWVPARARFAGLAGTTSSVCLGAMRIAPSRRMVSPFSIGFSTMWTARVPYSEASPSRAGCGTCAPRLLRASSFNPINSGVRNRPGAMVLTRLFWLAGSRAAGRVRPTTPPFEAE